MAKSRITKDQYINAVCEKLKDPKVDSMLRYGPLGVNFSGAPLRDDMGMQHTLSNMLQIAENLFDAQGGDRLAGAIATNFSQIGFGNVADVKTVGRLCSAA